MLQLSVVIPTWNRLPILRHTLPAVLDQSLASDRYEIIVVDDGSTDGTFEWLKTQQNHASHLKIHLFTRNQGRAKARNCGIQKALADIILFLDSDVLSNPDLLKIHLLAHQRHHGKIIVQGPLIWTEQWAPLPKPHLWTDASRAFFATGQVSIARHAFLQVGNFDESFTGYGWEDLELGLRLKKAGYRLVHAPEALGWHYDPWPTCEDLPALIGKEQARGRGAGYFYDKHPTLEVQLMAQMTLLHQGLAWVTGLVSLETCFKGCHWLYCKGQPALAMALLRGYLSRYSVTK